MTIKPATPLPWSVKSEPCPVTDQELSVPTDKDGELLSWAGYAKSEDARYIIHACNNFLKLQEQNAKLVEALEKVTLFDSEEVVLVGKLLASIKEEQQ